MASYEGNRLPAPGFYAGTATPPVEILYSEVGLFQKGGTLKPGQGVIVEGTGLKFDTATNRYVKAASASEVEGFIRYATDTGSDASAPVFQAIIVLGGKLKAQTLSVDGGATKLDDTSGPTTATALGGRYIASRRVLEF